MASRADKVQQLLKLKQDGDITLEQFLLFSGQVGDVAEPSQPAAEPSEPQLDEMDDNLSDDGSCSDAGGAEEEAAQDSTEQDCAQQEDDMQVEGEEEEELFEDDTSESVPIHKSILDFIHKNYVPPSKMSKPRKPNVSSYKAKSTKGLAALDGARNSDGRGASIKKNGSRVNDVKPSTMRLRLEEWPNQSLFLKNGQLWCKACSRNLASSKQGVAHHCTTNIHVKNVAKQQGSDANRVGLQAAIHDYKTDMTEQNADAKVNGLQVVAEEVQIARAECLEEMLKAGVEPRKLDLLRPYLERISCIALTGRQHMVTTFMPPLKIKEEKTLRAEFKGEFIGCYHDGTTHNGESFAVVYRCCKPGFIFRVCCVRVHFLRGSMTAAQISSKLLQTCAVHMQVLVHRCLPLPSESRCMNCSCSQC